MNDLGTIKVGKKERKSQKSSNGDHSYHFN